MSYIKELDDLIYIHYFSDGYGPDPEFPSLLFSIPQELLLEELLRLIRTLSSEEKTYCLNDEPLFRINNLKSVYMTNTQSSKKSRIGFFKRNEEPDKVSQKEMVIHLPQIGWESLGDSLKGMEIITHQYFDCTEAGKNLTLIFSYREGINVPASS